MTSTENTDVRLGCITCTLCAHTTLLPPGHDQLSAYKQQHAKLSHNVKFRHKVSACLLNTITTLSILTHRHRENCTGAGLGVDRTHIRLSPGKRPDGWVGGLWAGGGRQLIGCPAKHCAVGRQDIDVPEAAASLHNHGLPRAVVDDCHLDTLYGDV